MSRDSSDDDIPGLASVSGSEVRPCVYVVGMGWEVDMYSWYRAQTRNLTRNTGLFQGQKMKTLAKTMVSQMAFVRCDFPSLFITMSMPGRGVETRSTIHTHKLS